MQYRQLGQGMVQQMQAVCADCGGEGEVLNEKDRCKQCNGKKTKKEKKKLDVHIEKGMQDSQKIPFRGESNQEPGGVETGDLIVVLQCEEHDTFTRNHDDLFMTHTVNITEALCGFKLVIDHLDGRSLILNSPPGDMIAPGTIRAVQKEGMPLHKSPYEKGNLYVKFDVKFPSSNDLSEETIKKLEKLLPPKSKVEIPTGEHVDEVSMVEYESTRGSKSSHQGHSHGGSMAGAEGLFREAFGGGGHGDDDEDEGGAAGQRVECNTH
jgi:DnaJ family protein A protein 2